MRQLLREGFLVCLDLSVSTLLFTFITFDFSSKEWTGLAASTEMFLGRIETVNSFQINVIIRGHGLLQILPPVIQKPFFTNETEPWRKEQRFVTHHFNQDIASDPFHIVYFVGMTFDSEIRLGRDGVEKDVVDFVFTPWTVWSVRHSISSPVMKTRQKLEFVDVQFGSRNSEFVIEFSNGSILGSHDGPFGNVFGSVNFGGFHAVKGMRTTCISPNIWKGNFGRGPLLQEKLPGRFIENED
mmetsp:Transcript_8260/g.17843  ORF Transcript_8260/g.17843 Transcript_8260/m.17843 type:complete len:241 (+) Transcript_8260:1553-2275(+)